MRLSATERIIRDAEDQDDVTTLSPGNRDAGDALSNVDVDLGGMDDGDDGDGDDQEGATLVDTERVAIALKELRSYGVPPARAPSNTTGSYGVQPALQPSNTRPSQSLKSPTGHDFQGLPRPAASPGPVAAPVSPVLAGRSLRSPGAFAPSLPRMPMPGLATFAAPAHGGLGPNVVLTPPAEVAASSGAAGRRYRGILIVCVTAAVVALGVGAWTARWGASRTPATVADARAKGGLSAGKPNGTPRAVVSPVVVQTVPEAAAAPTPVAERIPEQGTVVSPSAADRSPSASGSPASLAPRRDQGSAVTNKARIVRNQAAVKASQRKLKAAQAAKAAKAAKSAKAAVARARSTRVLAPANPAKVRIPEARHVGSDPDATLPITD